MISVITPSNNCNFLIDAYESLKEQTFVDWEWIIILNGGEKKENLNSEMLSDDRIKISVFDIDIDRVGALKYLACKEAIGDIIVELDHDDILISTCLEEIYIAFQSNENACFVYSNFAQVYTDWTDYKFGNGNGWEYKNFVYKGRNISEVIAPEPYPHNVSLIWFAPNHVRAWKSSEYWKVGGHNQSLKVLDDQDLICKLFLHGKMIHINKCLYIYKIHGKNTWIQNSNEIQSLTLDIYDKYIYKMAEKWCVENNLIMIDLCGGINKKDGYTSLDIMGGDVNVDLNETWPIASNSVGIIRAYDAIEHLNNPIHTMNEMYRILAHGGFAFIMVPSTDGRGAYQDPTHVSFWNENSFWYYTKKNYCDFSRGKIQCRFQSRIIKTFFPNDFCKNNNISYVQAHLISIKNDFPKFHGSMEI